jgi:hypothetical protein
MNKILFFVAIVIAIIGAFNIASSKYGSQCCNDTVTDQSTKDRRTITYHVLQINMIMGGILLLISFGIFIELYIQWSNPKHV